ncbi:DNA polymerase beta superfamily protein [Aeromicrobium sp. Root472D3]|uniref:nucleotidyltransferase domain-containing protein n=1 Tax=Aeromicrobium sp. Root472D3 TaxID=1736540 RepID=UPI0006F90344|nr:nucleotidyltransferase domain-containing protein [Aeromicrobium sp. Root472D3]KQX74030.1 nucleotidyltransferase [Aeromicrobium sp. Root472D3]
MRAIPDTFDASVVTEIGARLAGVESDHGVRIPWAIESGSRAWGFPSPDSDYDCRFFYVRDEDAYLTPWLPRDVVETPLDAVFDVNGWDVRKAVELLARGNAVAVEWLRSPHVYRGDEGFRDAMLDLAAEIADRSAVGRHYTHVCRGQWERYGDETEMPLKRLFYALRPAACVRWLEAHPAAATPPMQLQVLLQQSGATEAVVRLVDELVEVKSRTREMGIGAAPAELRTYVADALTRGLAMFGDVAPAPRVDVRARAADAFRQLVRTYGPAS